MSSKNSLVSPGLAPLPLRGGELIGPYRLCFQIASGGMATVYLARADLTAGVHRFVALKRIHSHLMKDPVFVEMFKDEARIGAQVHHANVCSVFDFGVADGAYYLAMEYLAGESLSMVRRTMLRAPPETDRLVALACRVIADAAEGIHAAHELCAPSGAKLNIVHRDISPDNIFLTHDGICHHLQSRRYRFDSARVPTCSRSRPTPIRARTASCSGSRTARRASAVRERMRVQRRRRRSRWS
jgi:serine/threonine protein kinase